MRFPRRLLFGLAAVLGAAMVILPAVAGSETSPTVEAVNKPGSGIYAEEHHAWSPVQVAVSAGGAITIKNMSAVAHGVHWVAGPATPSCSSGVPAGTEATASGTHWSGTCTFAQVGTYTFYCTVHGPEMTGRVTVSAAGTPLPTSPTEGSPLAGSPSQAVKLASSHRAVRGSVKVSQAGAGGRLQVDLLAKRAALAGGGHSGQERVGRLVRSSLLPGTVSFTVALDAKAKRALRAHHRLALRVRVVLTPAHGSAVTVARSLLVHS